MGYDTDEGYKDQGTATRQYKPYTSCHECRPLPIDRSYDPSRSMHGNDSSSAITNRDVGSMLSESPKVLYVKICQTLGVQYQMMKNRCRRRYSCEVQANGCPLAPHLSHFRDLHLVGSVTDLHQVRLLSTSSTRQKLGGLSQSRGYRTRYCFQRLHLIVMMCQNGSEATLNRRMNTPKRVLRL